MSILSIALLYGVLAAGAAAHAQREAPDCPDGRWLLEVQAVIIANPPWAPVTETWTRVISRGPSIPTGEAYEGLPVDQASVMFDGIRPTSTTDLPAGDTSDLPLLALLGTATPAQLTETNTAVNSVGDTAVAEISTGPAGTPTALEDGQPTPGSINPLVVGDENDATDVEEPAVSAGEGSTAEGPTEEVEEGPEALAQGELVAVEEDEVEEPEGLAEDDEGVEEEEDPEVAQEEETEVIDEEQTEVAEVAEGPAEEAEAENVEQVEEVEEEEPVVLEEVDEVAEAVEETVLVTPDQTCENRGLRYAVQVNPFDNRDPPAFSNFNAAHFETSRPTFTGSTDRIGIPAGNSWTQNFAAYADSPPQIYTQIALNHYGFLYAAVAGQYTFFAPSTDDVTMVWVGDKALSGWNNGNADLVQKYVIPTSGPSPVEVSITLEADRYYPIRILWANGPTAFQFSLSIVAPGDITIMDGTTSNADFLVQRDCDGRTPEFPPLGPSLGQVNA